MAPDALISRGSVFSGGRVRQFSWFAVTTGLVPEDLNLERSLTEFDITVRIDEDVGRIERPMFQAFGCEVCKPVKYPPQLVTYSRWNICRKLACPSIEAS